MSEVKRYHLTETGLVEGVALGRLNVVLAADYEVARVREHELQQRLNAADEELDQCHSMALMIEEKEWAEHVGKGNISSRVESAFTQLHNELSEARQGLTAADGRADVLVGLLREVVALDPRGEFLGWQLDGKIDAALKPAEVSQ